MIRRDEHGCPRSLPNSVVVAIRVSKINGCYRSPKRIVILRVPARNASIGHRNVKMSEEAGVFGERVTALL